jgi:hypothetical protein
VDEFKFAIPGNSMRKTLSKFERMRPIDLAERFGLLVTDKNEPNRDFVALWILVRFRALEENSPPALRGAVPAAYIMGTEVLGENSC